MGMSTNGLRETFESAADDVMFLQNYFYVSLSLSCTHSFANNFPPIQTNAISVPVEITAGQLLTTLWDTDVGLHQLRKKSFD